MADRCITYALNAFGVTCVGCSGLFYTIFQRMLELHILNVDNEIHIYCLYYVYLTRINHTLSMFCDGLNNRPLSSEHNMTPVQLWVRGLYATSLRHEEEFSEVGRYCEFITILPTLNDSCVHCYMLRREKHMHMELTGMAGPLLVEYEDNEVIVPETYCPLNNHQEQDLLRTVSPSAPSKA